MHFPTLRRWTAYRVLRLSMMIGVAILAAHDARSQSPNAAPERSEAPTPAADQISRSRGDDPGNASPAGKPAPPGVAERKEVPDRSSVDPRAPQSVQHAQAAKIARCGALIAKKAHDGANADHQALSLWSSSQPDTHMFQSIIALNFPNTPSPNAAAILVASPRESGCEATLVQIHPSARSCSDIESDARWASSPPQRLGGIALTNNAGDRQLLVPIPPSGCVIVSVGLELQP